MKGQQPFGCDAIAVDTHLVTLSEPTMRTRTPITLYTIAAAVCALTAAPLLYVLARALGVRPELWGRLWTAQIPGLLANTAWLVALTVALGAVLGLAAAWLVERTDLPGRAVFRWLLALPLAVPAYVAAVCWVLLLRRGGLLDRFVGGALGLGLGELPLPGAYGLAGAAAVIGLCTFPYVYLPAAGVLRGLDRSLEEAARMAGRGPWGAFRDVTLPAVAPAVAAGALLVALYALSDFGTVAVLRYRTFTAAIYGQFAGQVDRAGAAALSAVLIALTVPLLAGESWLGRRGRSPVAPAWQPRRLAALGRCRWSAFALVALLATLALGVPLVVLGGLSVQGIFFASEADRIWNINSQGVWRYGLHSLALAAFAASAAVALALAPSYLAVFYPRRLARALLGAGKAAFALPGLIVGLGFVMLLSRWAPGVYGTVYALALGFTFRMLPQALAAGEAALARVPRACDQAARVMGCGLLESARRVTLPIAAPGVAASWALVFIGAMKELPTAVLLRPPGFDTLPVRIWAAASESVHTQAAPPAFLLIVLTTLPLMLLYARGGFGLNRALQEHA
jgi:iron(III) transport system permease protein